MNVDFLINYWPSTLLALMSELGSQSPDAFDVALLG